MRKQGDIPGRFRMDAALSPGSRLGACMRRTRLARGGVCEDARAEGGRYRAAGGT